MKRFASFIKEEPRIPRKKGQPAGSDKHSDLYTDENPRGTIHGLGFKDVETARASVKKIDSSGKTHAHKIQAAIAMEQRARVMGKKAEAAIYRAYIEKMKKKTKEIQKEDIELTEELVVYDKTATYAKNKSRTIYAFGRDKKLDGQPKEKGGYVLWQLQKRYAGHVRGGIAKNWAWVKKDLSYSDAVKLMNKKLGFKGFNEDIDITGLRTQLVKKMFSKQKYDVYHSNFSSVIQHIADMAKKLYGITIDPQTVTDTAKNKNKPKAGITKKFSLKGDKGGIKAFVYNRGGLDKPFELRMYQEDLEMNEGGG